MNSSKQILATGLLLMLFAIIGGGLVGATFEGTKAQIEENERRAMLRMLENILPAGSYDNDLINDAITLHPDGRLGQTESSTAYVAKKNNQASVIIFSVIAPDGYSGAIKLLVGINIDGTIAGVRVVSHKETPGLGDAIEIKRSNWILVFNDKSLEKPDTHGWQVKRDGGEFDQLTGATITPRAIVKAVHLSLLYFDRNKPYLMNLANKTQQP